MSREERKANRARIAKLREMLDREDYPSALLAIRDIDDFANKEEIIAAIKHLEAVGAISPKMSRREKEKTPAKLSDSERARLARRVFNSVRARTTDIAEKNIGTALARLMAAILNGIVIDVEGLSDYELGPMYALLLDAFDPADIGKDRQIEQLYSHIRFVL